jgi:hypothetical protein
MEMAEIVKEKVTTQTQGPVAARTTELKSVATASQTVEYVVYFIFGALEVLLVFRLILKLMGASSASGFVNFIYGLTGLFILPFEGIFRKAVSQGIETASVLEPSTIVAIVVYAVLAWGVVMLVRILSRERQVS